MLDVSVFGNDPVLVVFSDVVTTLVDNGAESLFTVIPSDRKSVV